MDQCALLVFTICRFPAFSLHRPGQPGQEVVRAALRIRYAADNVWVNTALTGQLNCLLQERGVARQQAHPTTSAVKVMPLQLG
ncbi:hypothetical protein D3C77_559600 [compost metagenome]